MKRIALISLLVMGWQLGMAQTTTSPVQNSFTTSQAPVTEKSKKGDKTGPSFMPSGVETLMSETLPDLGLKVKQFKEDQKDKAERRKKARLLKTEYEGIPIVEQYTKFGSGDRTIIEKFTVLKQYRQPNPYVRETYWFDPKAGRVSSALIKDKDKVMILHGPYKRYQNGVLLEEGFYYIGAKDGRWEKYDANYLLLDKQKWFRGFPAESEITYYDSAHTKIKEVLPKEFGQVHGQYMAFYEGGQLAAEGKYDHGVKVGRWVEYYQYRRQRKKITQYGRDRWTEEFEPYVISEWDDKGKITYERPKEKEVAEDDQ
ncbi:toxin-antitoxin system YwqK family antitoxin [Larkinella sp. VNQ87]|uniref:toxin-antitoxin system YwqK family antitoxin n=1 Tax=Larkinella sp. VNQ87 TaxID=3400921 RepID=UPI003BFB50B7